jgi:hypothetical protein
VVTLLNAEVAELAENLNHEDHNGHEGHEVRSRFVILVSFVVRRLNSPRAVRASRSKSGSLLAVETLR